MEYLISKSTFGVDCTVKEDAIAIQILVIRSHQKQVQLFHPPTNTHYLVEVDLPPGCYFNQQLKAYASFQD